jgi:CHASE2 domain-containing sensor protein
MQKWVVLGLDGTLTTGLRVTLAIGIEGDRAATEAQGYLPPNPGLVKQYERWQSIYRSLDGFRITPIKIAIGGSYPEQLERCRQLAQELGQQLNDWLNADVFRPLKEKLLKRLTPDEAVRVVIKTDDPELRQLPWQLWNFFDDYSNAEIALSTPEYDTLPASKLATIHDRVKILAILGNSAGIDVDGDRTVLETLAHAQITFLVEPHRNQLNDQLWEQDWDILFFAGHSSSQPSGETGSLWINATEQLTLQDLRYALKQAVRAGLQLAILNSCDGLGLARQLEDLQVPQIIVMREPVPDRVAQEFLKHFLTSFAKGKPLYLAVRAARERLQGLEDDYPCASWLPTLCQHPAALPFTWSDLLQPPETDDDQSLSQTKPIRRQARFWKLKIALLMSLMFTSGIVGVRSLGLLRPWELQAYDTFIRLRPDEGQDSRLLIVAVTEEDFQLPEQQQRVGSLSDLALARLLAKLRQFQARSIGLDIYRDIPSYSSQTSLARMLQTMDNVFAICKVRDRTKNHPGIAPPADVPIVRQGFSDVIQDSDGVLRRHLLAMKPDASSPCIAPYALSAQLALHYLKTEGITARYTDSGELTLNNIAVTRLRSPVGGYQHIETWGYQLFLNYRSYRNSPIEIAPVVTLAEILAGRVKPEIIKDRIVLIGVTSQSTHDYIPTPYSTQHGVYQEMPGVIVQAQMVSQLLSAVKDGRALLSVWPIWGDVLWILGWSGVGAAIAGGCGSKRYSVLVFGITLLGLSGLSLWLFIQGIWVPVVPAALTLTLTGSVTTACFVPQKHR